MYIFCGSQTIGMLQSGMDVDRILEISDDMPKKNSCHFIKNYPDIPVIIPSVWDNEDYLNELKKEQYDLLFANNPCSGLSLINKNAGANQPANKYFYDVFNAINTIQPKMFLIENAPTLVTKGLPILKDMTNILKDYNFTIVRDYAGNHNVCMKRLRTLVVGYKREMFNGTLLLHMNKQPKTTVKDVIGDLYDVPLNGIDSHYVEFNHDWDNLVNKYEHVKTGQTVLKACIENIDLFKDSMNESQIKEAGVRKAKLESGHNIWDKTPHRVDEDDHCGSISSVANYIHPKLNRDFTIREYARLMGYPDDFKFYPEECEISTIQSIAQGVPVNFIKYIANEIKEAYNGNRITQNGRVCFQHNTANKYNIYDDINEIEALEGKIKLIE
jgi:DNA (cytosine-5)-methyltransferase 1